MRFWIDVFIVLAVTAGWLGCLGYVRLRDPLDRLHCVTFSNIASGLMLLIAALLNDGMASRPLKIGLIWIITIISGAITSQATGRALVTRAQKV